MTNIVVLNSDAHRDLRVDPRPSEAHGDNVGMVGVVPREFARLVVHYPIFLRRTPVPENELGDGFECGVVLGFGNEENLFLDGDHWDALYVPLNIQRQPFAVTGREGDPAADLSVTVDLDSPRVVERGGEALFLADGQPSDYLQRLTAGLNELVQGTRIGLEYTAKLNQLGLIEPVRIDATFADGSQVKLEGLHSISRDKLQGLSARKLADLRDAGYLELIYFQLASLGQMNALIARKNRRLAGA